MTYDDVLDYDELAIIQEVACCCCCASAVVTLGVAVLNVCIEVPKGTPIGDVVPRLAPEDITAATTLFIGKLVDNDVATNKVGVRYVTATAKDTCESNRLSDSESERRRLKRESRVDGDQADTIGLSFKFDLIGNALDVAAAVKAANHLPYARSDAVVFRSPVWLNYGSGALQPSMRKCHGDVQRRVLIHLLDCLVSLFIAVCDSTCETCLDSSPYTCVSCHAGYKLASHSRAYSKCVLGARSG